MDLGGPVRMQPVLPLLVICRGIEEITHQLLVCLLDTGVFCWYGIFGTSSTAVTVICGSLKRRQTAVVQVRAQIKSSARRGYSLCLRLLSLSVPLLLNSYCTFLFPPFSFLLVFMYCECTLCAALLWLTIIMFPHSNWKTTNCNTGFLTLARQICFSWRFNFFLPYVIIDVGGQKMKSNNSKTVKTICL